MLRRLAAPVLRPVPGGLAAAVFCLLLWTAPPVAAEGSEPEPADPSPPADTVAEDPTFLEVPAFPGELIRRGVRLSFESGFLPDADIGPGHVTTYQPEFRGRLTLPLSKRAVLRFSGLLGSARYEFRGGDPLTFGNTSLTGDSLHLYRTRLEAQGAYRLNERGDFWLREGEVWALLGGLRVGSEFESGAFSDGVSGGGALALGYELEDKLRLVLGVGLTSSLEDGGVDVNPVGAIRWTVTPDLVLRNRGLGLQVDYRLSPVLEVFAAGFRTSESYFLRSISGVPDELTLRDRRVQTGVGLDWKISRRFRVITELGAVITRKLRIRDDDFGTLDSANADGSVYFEIRFDTRL